MTFHGSEVTELRKCLRVLRELKRNKSREISLKLRLAKRMSVFNSSSVTTGSDIGPQVHTTPKFKYWKTVSKWKYIIYTWKQAWAHAYNWRITEVIPWRSRSTAISMNVSSSINASWWKQHSGGKLRLLQGLKWWQRHAMTEHPQKVPSAAVRQLCRVLRTESYWILHAHGSLWFWQIFKDHNMSNRWEVRITQTAP